MINPYKHVNWSPDTRALRNFAKSLMIGFPVLALLVLLAGRFFHGTWSLDFANRLGGAGLAAGILFWLVPVLARPFYLVWYALSCAIGLVVSNLLLGLFYYTMFTATGILRRTLGKSPVQSGLDRAASTYWIEAPPQPEPKSYFHQS